MSKPRTGRDSGRSMMKEASTMVSTLRGIGTAGLLPSARRRLSHHVISAPLNTHFHGRAFRRRFSDCTTVFHCCDPMVKSIECQHKYKTMPGPCVNSCSNGVELGPGFGLRTATACAIVTPGTISRQTTCVSYSSIGLCDRWT